MRNPKLPNSASVLKEEIARLVRRQLRGETENLKKASSCYRSEIAALKRRIEALEKHVLLQCFNQLDGFQLPFFRQHPKSRE